MFCPPPPRARLLQQPVAHVFFVSSVCAPARANCPRSFCVWFCSPPSTQTIRQAYIRGRALTTCLGANTRRTRFRASEQGIKNSEHLFGGDLSNTLRRYSAFSQVFSTPHLRLRQNHRAAAAELTSTRSAGASEPRMYVEITITPSWIDPASAQHSRPACLSPSCISRMHRIFSTHDTQKLTTVFVSTHDVSGRLVVNWKAAAFGIYFSDPAPPRHQFLLVRGFSIPG